MRKYSLLIIFSVIILACGHSEEPQSSFDADTVSSTSAKPVDPNERAKTEIFNDVNNVREALSYLGIGKLSEWKYDDYDSWYSVTKYYDLGDGVNYKMGSNLAIYLESKNENYIKEMKLVLNINTPDNKVKVLKTFSENIAAIYDALKLKSNSKIIEAAKKGEEFKSSNAEFEEQIFLEMSNIETWKFIITTK